MRNKAVAAGLILGLFCALGRLTHLFPFAPAIARWSLQEDYTKGQIPKSGSVQQFHCARSDAGILIGVDGPGYVEWKFFRPGPFPTVVEPFFVPASHQAGRITLRTPTHPGPVILFKDLPLRNRPFDITSYVQNEKVFALRFEGTQARLEDIQWVEPAQIPSVPWAVLALFIAWTLWALKKDSRQGLALAMVSLLGFGLRWKSFCTYFSLPLEGDASGYWSLGQALDWHHPFLTGPREPGFIWMVSLARMAFGDSIRSLRLMGVLVSTLWIPVVAEVAAAAGWTFWVGLAAAAMVSTNPFAAFMSVQGYQLEFFTLLILLFSIAWLKNRERPMGWLGGLLCITRVQSFLAIIPLVALADIRFRWKNRTRLGCWVPFWLLTLPYLIAVRQETGSFLGHINRHAGFYEHIQAQDLGQAAPPDAALGLGHFLFAGDALGRRAVDLLKGYLQVLFDPLDPFNRILLNSHYARAWNLLFLPFFWMGIYAFLKNSQERWFLWLPLLFLSGLPMLHDVIREPRLLFHVEPFLALLTARGVWFIARARKGS